jgi:hypothetical protein
MATNQAELDDFLERVNEVDQQVRALLDPSTPAPKPDRIVFESHLKKPVPTTSDREIASSNNAATLGVDQDVCTERQHWWRITCGRIKFCDPGSTSASSDTVIQPSRTHRVTDYSMWEKWVKAPDDPVTREERIKEDEV